MANIGGSGSSSNVIRPTVGFTTAPAVSPSPLRSEIESVLNTARPSGNNARSRNDARRTLIREYLERNYPGDTRTRDLILQDLPSYPQWEKG